MKTVSITSTVKNFPQNIPFEDIKLKILGPKYELSLVFVGKKRALSLNQKYRQKTYSPNVLSFPLDDKNGEIIICPNVSNQEAYKYGLSQTGYLAFLFIHGLLHLKGHDHGATMERLEKKYLKLFAIN